ncbi:hypothetical protein [Streptococcus pneumoniae]|uniref:hypothetical protein n=1 Tax=Streptococcus pneumoniae TaxID=1313 RepID=UPI00067DAA01|nr:hypothetical protein [Streptococcus pneumoniae]
MKIKEQTKQLVTGCSNVLRLQIELTKNIRQGETKSVTKHCFEVVDETDGVSNHTYGKATLTWFEEIFEE